MKTVSWPSFSVPRLPVLAAALLGLSLAGSPAHAAFTLAFEQIGSDVVASGSGTINLTALSSPIYGNTGEGYVVIPANGSFGLVEAGAYDPNSVAAWSGFTGPADLGEGTGSAIYATSNSGDDVGIFSTAEIYVPDAYVSGAALSDSSTWTDETISGLGLNPGSYTWNWGSGPTADSFTVTVSTVPEPAMLALFGAGGLVLLGIRRRVSGAN